MKMKKSLLGLTILLSAGLTVHVEAADQKAVVATAGDIKPFSYQNTKGQLTGYDIQVSEPLLPTLSLRGRSFLGTVLT